MAPPGPQRPPVVPGPPVAGAPRVSQVPAAPQLVAMHRRRGALDEAMTQLHEIFTRALKKRMVDSLFDVHVLFPEANSQNLLSLQRELPPCDILQERPGDADAILRDGLYSVDLVPIDASELQPSSFARTIEAQQHFVYVHINQRAREFRSSPAADPKCPFFNACGLDVRRANPEVCEKTPWLAYHGEDTGCWYGGAATACRGTIKNTDGNH